jgi:alpha-D-ribose 1-methylphosphonate 5-triphosphate synthase subunit PhnH
MRAGFADPVLGAQAAFRAVMEAMARPGRPQRLATPPNSPPPLAHAAAAVLLALADAETPVWTDAPSEARAWIAFHTGATLVDLPGEAEFLLATGPIPPLMALRAGSDEAPQHGATLIAQVTELEAESGWRLSGPGIASVHHLSVTGLPADFVDQWRANTRRFPRGVDVVLAAGDALAALPRTVRIEEGG